MALPKWMLAPVLIFIMLFCGACLTLNKKLQYQTMGMGIDPTVGEHAFRKPWFCTCCMFVGEAAALLVLGIKRLTGNDEEKKCELSWWGIIWRCTLPACLDLSASGFASVGLLYITASSFQMLRGWSILFTALLSRFWLQRTWEQRQLVGLWAITLAMAVVGFASSETADSMPDEVGGMVGAGLWGVMLVTFAQLFQATQFVWEEKVMKGVFIPPLLLLGLEGIVGVIVFCTFVFPLLLRLPGDDVGGCQENIWDSLVMLSNSPGLVGLFSVYLVCVCALNCSAVYVTKVLSGVHRTLVQTGLRTMFIWAAGIMLYNSTAGTYGEPWKGFESYIQLVGFVLFLTGSMLYSKLIELPFSKPRHDYKVLPAGP